MPPKGSLGSLATSVLIETAPESMRRATAWARSASVLQTVAPRP